MMEATIDNIKEEVKDMPKNITEEHILSMLFEQVEKPKNYFKIKAINVYDNAYRINIYSEVLENNLTKRKISHSYFVKAVDGSLNIIQGN